MVLKSCGRKVKENAKKSSILMYSNYVIANTDNAFYKVYYIV